MGCLSALFPLETAGVASLVPFQLLWSREGSISSGTGQVTLWFCRYCAKDECLGTVEYLPLECRLQNSFRKADQFGSTVLRDRRRALQIKSGWRPCKGGCVTPTSPREKQGIISNYCE